MFHVGLPCYLGLNWGQSVSINSNETRKYFSRTFMARECYPNASQFPMRETLFPVSVFVFKMQIMLTLHGGEFKRKFQHALAKFLRARASEHSSNFCEQFEQRPNFASTFKLDGTIRKPYISCHKFILWTSGRKQFWTYSILTMFHCHDFTDYGRGMECGSQKPFPSFKRPKSLS